MQFTKLFSSILDSTIWQESPTTKLVWITMLAMVDRSGEVHASVPGLAKRAGVSLIECETALECLLAPDKYSRTPDFEGRRIREIDGGWELLNHAKYRALLSKEERREYNRLKQAEYRGKKRENVNDASMTVNDNVSNAHITEAESEAESEAEKDTPPAEKPEEEVFQFWNSIDELPKIVRISKERRAKMKTRLGDSFFRENWRKGIEAIPTRPFLMGDSDRGWKADIDWFMQPDSLTKIIEGKYTQSTKPQTAHQKIKSGSDYGDDLLELP